MNEDIPQPLNRAQRRFLGLTMPIGAQELTKHDFVPVEDVAISSVVFKMLTQQHLGAGRLRGGTLLGFQVEGKLCIEVALPSNHTYQHPFAMEPAYLLGALDAVLQVTALPLDWVGNWVMPADGRQPDAGWTEETWHAARREALVSASSVLLTVGMAEDRLVIEAWSEREGQPFRLPVKKQLFQLPRHP